MDNDFDRNRVPNQDIDRDDLHGDNSEEEAEEDRDAYINDDVEQNNEDESEEGDNLDDHYSKDYQEIPGLDKYESEGIDEDDYSQISESARREAERMLDDRERENVAHNRRVPQAMMMNETEESLLSEGHDLTDEIRKRREKHFQECDDEPEDDDPEDEKYLDLEEMRGKLNTWIREPRTIRFIRRHFKRFLLRYRDENTNLLIYETRINDMCSANRQSLEVTYSHLTQQNPTLAYWVFETPSLVFPILNQVAFELACKYFPGYENIHHEIYIKIRDFPLEEKLRDLRTFHLNTLIKIRGVVTRRYPVYSQLKKIFYICRCGNRMGPIFVSENQDIKLGQCPVCHSNGPFQIDQELGVYRNYQKITVQESPGSVLPGRVPRHKDTILLGDNIDLARPGDEVEIVGIYTNKFDFMMNVKHGFPVFNTIIEANYVKRCSELNLTDLSQQDKDDIMNLSKKPNVARIVINSIAPSIYGHHNIKTALALAMFGGMAKNYQDSHKIRGDINVLLLGDPG